MEGFYDEHTVKAIVYLLAEGDEKNRMLISEDELIVIRKDKKEIIPLKNIRKKI